MSHTLQRVPVGFRFHPTDEELVGYYLPKKLAAKKIDLDLIRDLDLYKMEPWDLHELCKIQADTTEKQNGLVLLQPQRQKISNGKSCQPGNGRWLLEATGRDKPIHTKLQVIGMRKTLVFYKGRAPHGTKTDWIMHEFRLDDGPGMPAHEDGGWVVCRVFKKTRNFKTKVQERACSFDEHIALLREPNSPEIHSGDCVGGDGGYLFANSLLFPCKQETNMDEYNPSSAPFKPHLSQLAMPRLGSSHVMPPSSSSEYKGLLDRNDSKTDDYYPESFTLENLVGELTESRPSVTHEDGFPGYDGVDWSLYEGAGKDMRFPATSRGDQALGDVTILVQLKRPNSDYFSSCEQDLWNFSQK